VPFQQGLPLPVEIGLGQWKRITLKAGQQFGLERRRDGHCYVGLDQARQVIIDRREPAVGGPGIGSGGGTIGQRDLQRRHD
jgi:hypothetical protein